MIVWNADQKLAKDIGDKIGCDVVFADTAWDLQDDREQGFIGKWFAPFPSDAVSLEIDSMLMLADFGARVTISGGDVLELDAQPSASDEEMPF